jgi:hypothetical protein
MPQGSKDFSDSPPYRKPSNDIRKSERNDQRTIPPGIVKSGIPSCQNMISTVRVAPEAMA